MNDRIILQCGCAEACTDTIIPNWHKDNNEEIMQVLERMLRHHPHMKEEVTKLLEELK